jgi:hypothetical protein
MVFSSSSIIVDHTISLFVALVISSISWRARLGIVGLATFSVREDVGSALFVLLDPAEKLHEL